MDYGRIYREFIADRRGREAGLTGYFERHHVLPKSRGGTDAPANLIRLTAEDHFFAHLLLAKMHGGGMWMAVRRMRWGRVGGERPWVRGRYMYAVARRRQAEHASASQKGQPGKRGADNGHYDAERREWTNLDTGQKQTATTAEMWERHGGCRAHWTSAVKGARKSAKGWTPNPSAVRVRSVKGQSFCFVNRDGRNFTGTQTDFCRWSGVGVASACRVIKAKSVTVCGWRRAGVVDRPHNFAKADGLPCRKRRSAA
jgi:hypothetical protein